MWPPSVRVPEGFGDDFLLFVIVPNLDRRRDRWSACHERLIEKGVPDHKIIRFSAFDYQSFDSVSHAKETAKHYFGEDMPKHLEEVNLPDYNVSIFAWLFTWHAILWQIAQSVHDHYYLLLIDDCYIRLTYGQLCYSIHTINNHATNPIKMLQTCRNPFQPVRTHPTFDPINIWQTGLTERSDIAVIYSHLGARLAIETSAYHGSIKHPSHVIERIAVHESQDGLYGVSKHFKTKAGDGSGAAEVFDFRLEYQDRPATDLDVRQKLRPPQESVPERFITLYKQHKELCKNSQN